MSSWNRPTLRKLFIQLLAILIIVVATGMMHALPASSDPGDGGRWFWDDEHERRIFIPEDAIPRPSRPSIAADTAPNGVTSPYIKADPQDEWIYGWYWPVGNTVYVCVDSGGFPADPTNPAECDLFADSMVAIAPYGMVDFNVSSSLDLHGGHYISMTDTFTTKEHMVTNLTVTGADAVADTVSGTADTASVVYVYESDGSNWLYPIADGFGDWVASYSGIFDLHPGSDGFASQYDADSDRTLVYWSIPPNTTISAQPASDRINGSQWLEGETVHVCVASSGFAADPTNPSQCDLYYDSASYAYFDLSGSHDLQSGDYIAMTDGTTTKQHQVTALVITDVDTAADTVSGTAAPGSAIEVRKGGCSGCTLHINANGSGDWVADFSSIGQDIEPGSIGYATQYDGDDDYTWDWWIVPNPHIGAFPSNDEVYANDWLIGSTVDICIDDTGFASDPTDPLQCDLFHDSAVIPDPGYGTRPYYRFEVGGMHDLMAGDYIAMTDGTTTKQHQVTALDVTGVDPDTDIVWGIAAPGTDVEVALYDPYIVFIDVVADGSGDWQADFSAQIDIVVGSHGYATQYDPDDDETWERWEVINPEIQAAPLSDQIWGYKWPEGGTVHVCVDDTGFAVDPTNPGQCDLYYETTVVPADSWGSISFDLYGTHDLVGGDYIAMTDGTTTKQHQVTNLVVTDIDPDADTVSGTADPGTEVDVYEYNGGNSLLPVADGSGDWVADFSGITDLVPGSNGSASQYDADSDLTRWYWEVPNPTIEVQPDDEEIKGWEWPEGEMVHVCVDSIDFAVDPTNPAQCDLYHGSDTVVIPPGWSRTRVEFDLDGILDLQGGHYIAMTDGTTTKQHQVTNLIITGVDPDADTVSGMADPGSLVEVYEYDGGNWLFPITNGSGDWLASYSGIYDLQPESSGFARQYDGDSDQTRWYWEVPNPTIEAQPDYEEIKGWEWPEGEMVHVCVDSIGFSVDPTNPAQCDLYHGSDTVVLPPGWPITSVEFDLDGILDLQGGHYIAMTDGTATKQHQVTNLVITDVDPDMDTVSGMADPGSSIRVFAMSGSLHFFLEVIADGSGNWEADFSSLLDLDFGSYGDARQTDGDGDETLVSWHLSPPSPPRMFLYLEEEAIEGYGWPEGNTVHLCINAGTFATDPTIPGQCSLYNDSMTAFIPPGWDDRTLVDFDLDGIFDVQSGQYVSLSDGITRRDLLVANLAVTGWDVAADTLAGTADPNADVYLSVFFCSECWLDVTADGSGNWVADFSGIADLQPGDQGDAVQYDTDWDGTNLTWSIPLYELFLPLILR